MLQSIGDDSIATTKAGGMISNCTKVVKQYISILVQMHSCAVKAEVAVVDDTDFPARDVDAISHIHLQHVALTLRRCLIKLLAEKQVQAHRQQKEKVCGKAKEVLQVKAQQ